MHAVRSCPVVERALSWQHSSRPVDVSLLSNVNTSKVELQREQSQLHRIPDSNDLYHTLYMFSLDLCIKKHPSPF